MTSRITPSSSSSESTQSTKPAKPIYRINFLYDETIYEIYAKEIAESAMFGFLEAEEFIFNTKTQIVLDPSEERLKQEFQDVTRTYIPLHSILRIDEVRKEGIAKIHPSGSKGNISPFPSSMYRSNVTTPKSED